MYGLPYAKPDIDQAQPSDGPTHESVLQYALKFRPARDQAFVKPPSDPRQRHQPGAQNNAKQDVGGGEQTLQPDRRLGVFIERWRLCGCGEMS